MLKTYITQIDTMKKYEIGQYLKYLMSSSHKNHIGRTKILNNSQDHKKFFKLNSDKIRGNIKNQLEKKREKKRGWHNVLKDSNKSLTFNVPISYNPTDQELIEIQDQLMKLLIEEYKSKGVEVSEEDFFSNIHKQQNNHINFIIPGIDKETFKSIRFLKEKSFRPELAEHFTEIVDNVLGTSFENYTKSSETLAMLKNEEEKFVAGDYSIEDLEELVSKKYTNKMLKNLYRQLLKLKKSELKNKKSAKENKRETKELKGVNRTIKKLLGGEMATKEEKQEARDILASLNGGNILTEEAKKEIRKGTKTCNNRNTLQPD